VRGALHAAAGARVTTGPHGQRIGWTHAWPVVLRPAGALPGGGDRLHLVHAAGGPLGGDVLALDLDLGPGAWLAVHSAGATLVQPGAGPTAGVPARWAG
jgi:urease accessory protein